MAIGTAVVPATIATEDLRAAHALLRNEVRRAHGAVEEERRRIARELHDEFGQALTGLKFDLARFGMTLSHSSASPADRDMLKKIQSMSGSVDALLTSVRTTAAALRPAMLDDLGLVPALECLATTFAHRTGARCAVEVHPEFSSIVLPAEVSTALFRIAQELVTNVMRHAGASHVRIRLYQDNAMVMLEVTDNGTGDCPRENQYVSCLWASRNAGTSLSPRRPLSYRGNVRRRNHGHRLRAGCGVFRPMIGTQTGENSRHRRSRSRARGV